MIQTPERECYFLLRHPEEPAVLLIYGEEGWYLPHCSLPPHMEYERAQLVRVALRGLLGIDGIILHVDYRWQKPESKIRQTFFTIEILALEQPLPASASWLSRDSCTTLKMAIPWHRQVLETWWRERVPGGKQQVVPWQYPGWFGKVSAWVTEQLYRLQMPPVASIEQLYTKFGACMLRATTPSGTVYLKALPDSFAHEPALVAWLAKRYPEHIPGVLAVDLEHHWLLTRDAGKQLLQECEQIEAWELALREFASLQIRSITALDDLFAIGCADMRMKRIEDRLEALLDDRNSLMLDRPGGLTSSEVEALYARLPRMKAACRQLAGYALPETLEHGDFNPTNILLRNEGVIYLDWTDSTITHPFFSALRLLHYFLTPAIKVHYPDAFARLQLAYLEPWTRYEPMERLLLAFKQALLPMFMQRALFYSQLIFTQQGISWERSTVVPNHLRTLLKHRDMLP